MSRICSILEDTWNQHRHFLPFHQWVLSLFDHPAAFESDPCREIPDYPILSEQEPQIRGVNRRVFHPNEILRRAWLRDLSFNKFWQFPEFSDDQPLHLKTLQSISETEAFNNPIIPLHTSRVPKPLTAISTTPNRYQFINNNSKDSRKWLQLYRREHNFKCYNIMQSAAEIRKKKEQMRKETLKTLKLPRVFGGKKSSQSTVAVVQKPVKLDKRCFANIFKLNQKIGQGANGFVHKCTEIKSGLTYAVKILEGDQEFVRIVKQNYQILKYFDSDSIIKGKCCFINENTEQIYLVMEYCSYPSLAKTIQQNLLTDQAIKTLMSKLLEAVNLLHQEYVCHRDLKPQNILYDVSENKIKIIDFGISKAIYNRRTLEKESMWTVTGSQYYKAPEMLNGSAYDQKVDAWALGVIAYQLIFGKLPFYSEYLGEVIEQILSQEPNYNSEHVTPLDVDFIKALLKKDPKYRLSCAEALRHPWIENQIRFKKSDDLSSSEYIFMRNDFPSPLSRKPSPTASTLVINPNTVNINDLMDAETGIFQIRKDMDISNWLSLRHRSNSIICSSSGGDSLKENACSIEYEMNMVGLDL